MSNPNSEEQGSQLLSAVERLLADPDILLEKVERIKARVPVHGTRDDAWRRAVANRIISSFSNRSAISGGASAAPAIIPGVGTVVALVGGTLADMALMLKFEVEMILCLSTLFGYDIRSKRERQIAFLMAGVSTYEARADRNLFVDLASAEGTAIWNYTPRQLSKMVVSIFAKVALLTASKSFARAIPFVGVAVGATMNKALTHRVGTKCFEALCVRHRMDETQRAEDPPVAARVVDAENPDAEHTAG